MAKAQARKGVDFGESLKMATTTLIANKLRSGLTMLGIIIGNASVIAMVGIGQGTQKLAEDQFKNLGPNTLFILPGGPNSQQNRLGLPRTLVNADAQAIKRQVPSIAAVAAQLQSSQAITYESKNSTSQVVGTTPSFLTVRSFEINKGRFLNDDDVKNANLVVVLGPDLAEKLFEGREAIGQKIRVKNISFEVIGITVAKGSSFGSNQDDIAYVPLSTASRRIVGRNSPFGQEVSFISVSAKDADSLSAAEFQITNLLRRRHKIINDDDFTVRNQKDALQIVGTITGGLTLLLGAIAGISLLVGGIGVMNIMLVSVTERTQEIGLRKAIGATQGDILMQFIIESVILSAAGGVVGTLIGIGGVVIVAAFSPLPASVAPASVIMAVTVSGAIGLFFGVVPAKRAASLDPIVALRSV
jgi:putative ABC transport system permease protein